MQVDARNRHGQTARRRKGGPRVVSPHPSPLVAKFRRQRARLALAHAAHVLRFEGTHALRFVARAAGEKIDL